MEKNEIRKAISRVKLEDEEEHERKIECMVQEDYYKPPWKNKDATVATGLKTVTYSSDSDTKPAARKEPIKDTQTIKEPIKGSTLEKSSLFNRWNHRHGPSLHRIRYHWTRRISDY